MEKDGEDGKETNEKTNEANKIVDKSYITRKWLFIIAQWVMVIIVIVALVYLFNNIESIKMAQDPCGVCVQKFNVSCYNNLFHPIN